MTCIAAVADGKSVWIGADSAASDGNIVTARADPKLFVNGPMVFGFTSSFRMGQLIRHSLIVPKHFEGDADKWMCTTFIDAVRRCLKDGGWATNESGKEVGGVFLAGYRGRLYEVYSDYQVAESIDQFASVGCGAQFALGSLHTSTGSPEKRIRSALAAAARFSPGVGEPFHVLVGPDE